MKATETKAKRDTRKKDSYTVLGQSDTEARCEDDLSVLVLARGEGFYRDALFESLYTAGFSRILYAASGAERAKGESMSQRFPGVRFLFSSGNSTAGALINLGMREMGSGKILVLWSDMRLVIPAFSARLRRRIAGLDALCAAPWLEKADGKPVASLSVPRPSFEKAKIKASAGGLPMESLVEAKEETCTLFPYDYCGIYDAEHFLESGGFDESIADPWWQVIDFGLGTWASGGACLHMPTVALRYIGEAARAGPCTDAKTSDASWARLWLKRICPADSGLFAATGRYIAYRRAGGNRPGARSGGFREYKTLAGRRNAAGVSIDEAFEQFARRSAALGR